MSIRSIFAAATIFLASAPVGAETTDRSFTSNAVVMEAVNPPTMPMQDVGQPGKLFSEGMSRGEDSTLDFRSARRVEMDFIDPADFLIEVSALVDAVQPVLQRADGEVKQVNPATILRLLAQALPLYKRGEEMVKAADGTDNLMFEVIGQGKDDLLNKVLRPLLALQREVSASLR